MKCDCCANDLDDELIEVEVWVDNGNNDEGNDDGSDEVVDVDSTLLDWCPDPLNHLLSFFLLPETQNVSDIDNELNNYDKKTISVCCVCVAHNSYKEYKGVE